MAPRSPRMSPALRQWAQLALQATLGLVLFAMLLIVGQRTNQRYDLTPQQRYSLSDEARQVVESIREPVTITIFFDAHRQGYRRTLEDRLQLFSDASPFVSYRLIDLDRNPREAERLRITSYNSGIVETASGSSQRLRAATQETITAALLSLTKHDAQSLCFVTGHGEQDPHDNRERFGYSRVAKALEQEHYRIERIDLVPSPGEGEHCDVLIVAGPRQELLATEVDHLVARLAAGGPILFMIDPNAPPSAERFLARAGIRVFDDLIVDERSRFYGADSFMPRVGIIDHAVFGDRIGDAIFSLARTVHPADEAELDTSVRLLAITGQESWARFGDTEDVSSREIRFRPEIDKRGPLPVAAFVRGRPAGEGEEEEEERSAIGPMIVFGDSDFPNNLYLDLFGNRDLFMSSIAVLARQDRLIGRRQQQDALNFPILHLTDQQVARIFQITVLALPALSIALGILVVWRRRRRAGM